MNDDNITIPRDNDKKGNTKVTKEVETFLLDIFSKNADDAFTYKELRGIVASKFRHVYGDDLKSHTNWALDMLHYNSLIKRVAPGTFESVDGPDDVYTERETGHSPEGEFSNRGKNVNNIVKGIGSKSDFNHELRKTIMSVKILKNLGRNQQEIAASLTPDKFNPVALKIALKQAFDGIKADTDDDVKLRKENLSLTR